ncbi:MAG: nucleoside recognition domain-containing protein [Limisphaerales bacterium]|jgi:spore maturation protein SpmA
MLNALWLTLIVAAALLGGFLGNMKGVVDGAVNGAETAVTLAISLVGIMGFWLGLMRLAEKAGLVQSMARLLQPILRRLFPEIPEGHPAMSSMVMNIAANMLGLLNAATPLGLRAMHDLEKLNPHPGTATNAMCTFLAINTSSVQLLPMTAVAILAVNGSANPTSIIGTAFLATLCSTIAGISAVKWLERRRWFKPPATPAIADNPFSDTPTSTPAAPPPQATQLSLPRKLLLAGFCLCFGFFFLKLTLNPDSSQGGPLIRAISAASILAIPFLAALFPLYAALQKIPVYEEFVEGAKEGFQVAVRIIPYLVAMLVAIGMFRGAGGIELLTHHLKPILQAVGFPSELLPMALVRPLSGTASIAVLRDLVGQFGSDHLLSRTAATILGSTETTFYVVALYFGAINIQRTRHAIPAGLFADAIGVIASILICRLVFG